MKKLIALLAMVGVILASTVFAGSYPREDVTKNPIIQELVDALIAEDFTLLGAGEDIYGVWILWVEVEGICGSFYADPSSGRLVQLRSCGEALQVWEKCVTDGGCIDPNVRL